MTRRLPPRAGELQAWSEQLAGRWQLVRYEQALTPAELARQHDRIMRALLVRFYLTYAPGQRPPWQPHPAGLDVAIAADWIRCDYCGGLTHGGPEPYSGPPSCLGARDRLRRPPSTVTQRSDARPSRPRAGRLAVRGQ